MDFENANQLRLPLIHGRFTKTSIPMFIRNPGDEGGEWVWVSRLAVREIGENFGFFYYPNSRIEDKPGLLQYIRLIERRNKIQRVVTF